MNGDGYVLAIDQGTTGTKVVIFNHAGDISARAFSEFAQHYPQPGWVEHDAEEIWRTTLHLIAEALAQARINAANLRAIGITNQRETAIMWERASGEAIGPAIVWQDRRTAVDCDSLRERGLEETIRRKTGLVVDAYFSATKIRWMLDNTEGLRERAERGEIAFGTVDSWLIWKLTGAAKVHATDYSNASRTMLYNIYELRWDEDLLEIFGVPEALLPHVRPSAFIYGETDPEVFFGARVPIAGVAGDQHAALFGQACYGEGLAKNTYGTGSFVLLNTGHEAVPSQSGLLTTIAWAIGDEPVEYALEGAVFITGAGVQWLRDGLGIISEAAETEALALSLASNEGVYFVPALVGLGAPHWDAYARGTITGITRGTTRAHIARAALESICYQTRDVVETMERESGIRLQELRADGGAVVNSFLMQFQADILGVPVEVPAVTETTSLGAAYLAGLAAGFWESREELDAKWKMARRYEPQMDASQREELYARWLKAVARAKNWA
jgi:glycerol kinase